VLYSKNDIRVTRYYKLISLNKQSSHVFRTIDTAN
jgi:hypothetical protein